MSSRKNNEATQRTDISHLDEYERALSRIEEIFDAKPGTMNGAELEPLLLRVEAYEREAFPIEPPHPDEAVRFRKEQEGAE
jgi:HTH-type transcriptional regulator / antitoxin HigA